MSLFAPNASLNTLLIEEIIRAALNEDLGRAGDITSHYCVPENATGRVALNARQAGAIAGLPLAQAAFRMNDATLVFTPHLRDGDLVTKGQTLAIIEGNARAMLASERVALNFLGHLSGIATLTSLFADKIKHTKAKITCTRKTTPLLRAFEKYAVKAGGGSSHRYGLDDAILIKDNHIALGGGIANVLERARANAGHLVRIEIEVDTLAQFQEVLAQNIADVVLLDNMSPELLAQAVSLNQGRVILEASGNVNLESVQAIAQTGVDYISCGALTHSVKTLDIGLDTLS